MSSKDNGISVKPTEKLSEKREVNWVLVIIFIQIFFAVFWGLHCAIYNAYWTTTIFSIFLVFLGVLGVTAGAHRLWAHQSYEATTSFKVFLMLCQTLAGQWSIYDWVRWHRLHHKYFGTNLDPYNPSKGFFYSHLISNTLKFSPAQKQALEEIDMSDLEQDKIVMFQKKYYWVLVPIITLLLPINAPAEYWGENLYYSAFIAGFLRYGITMQFSWLVHSATKIWDLNVGEKYPQDSYLVFVLNKNYWLSYHYLAPWDYQTGEFGKYGTDYTSKFLRVCAALEFATNLQTVGCDSVREALSRSITEKKSIQDCLVETRKNQASVKEEHYLTPYKFY